MMYKTILHATDLQSNHFDLCTKALQLAKYHHATLHLLHVMEVPASFQVAQNLGFAELAIPAQDDVQIVMKTLAEALGLPATQTHVEVGAVDYHILEKAKALSCELIILGSSQGHLLKQAPCDVLILHT